MRYFFSWLTVATYTAFVTAVSVLPVKQPAGINFPHADKVSHFVLYAIFAYIVVNTLRFKKFTHPSLIGITYIFFVGLTLEVFQHFLLYRSFEVADVLANCAGGIVSLPLKVTAHLQRHDKTRTF